MQLSPAAYLFCRHCHEFIGAHNLPPILRSDKFPDDWSFIQYGSAGKYKEHDFKIIGRVRLQLRNDYKNFWTAEYKNGELLWIVESFGSFGVFSGSWLDFQGNHKNLRAGKSIDIGALEKIFGEYVEKCEAIQYAGEIGPWRYFSPTFFLVQAGIANAVALFTVRGNEQIQFMFGEKMTIEQLHFTNILQWDEWK
ncbi:hypothetical protein DQQ10_26190 [Pseudochryseolinea flava]|uniref:DUF4178 domain-containing protein n=1 Tax=Pseudochryseolinea flava TaxID=2059302 RepID=A0A364XUX0_9BACT|nr:hypothetical protein DQQ10_26190 [Pseudochryseolinea flava]